MKYITITILLLVVCLNCINTQFSNEFKFNYLKKEESFYNSAWSNVNLNYLFNLFCSSADYETKYELLFSKTISQFIPSTKNLEKTRFFTRAINEIDSMKSYNSYGTNNQAMPDSMNEIIQDHFEDIRIPTISYLNVQIGIERELNQSDTYTVEEITQENARSVHASLLTRIEQAYNINSKPSRLQYTGQLFIENAFLYLATLYEGIYNGRELGIPDSFINGVEMEDGSFSGLGSLDARLNELSLDVLNKFAKFENSLVTVQRSLCLLGLVCVIPSDYKIPTWSQLSSIFWYSNTNFYGSPIYFITDLPGGHNNLSSSLSVDLNKPKDSIYVIDWYLIGKSITAKPFTYFADPFAYTNQVADYMTGLRGYAFSWKGAGLLNPLSGSASFSSNIKFNTSGTNRNVMFAINFGDGIGSGDNLAINSNANKFILNFYEKNFTTNVYSLISNISTTYSFNQRDGTIQNNFIKISTIVNRLDYIGGRYTLETRRRSFNSKEIKVELIPIYPFDIHLLSLEVVTH